MDQNVILTRLRLGIDMTWYDRRFAAGAYSKLLDADTQKSPRDFPRRKHERLVSLGAVLAPASLAGDPTLPAAFSKLLIANGTGTFRCGPVTAADPRVRASLANQMREDKVLIESTHWREGSRRGRVHGVDVKISYAEKLSVS